MSMRAVLAVALAIVSSLFALPEEAEAGKPKSPFWAHINEDGAIVRSNGAVHAFRFHTGDYYVDFAANLTNCAFAANTSTGYAYTVGVSNESPGYDVSRVRVFIVDATATLLNAPFYLIATCLK